MTARAWGALSRGDDEVVLRLFHPEVEFHIIGGGPNLIGLREHYRGHEGWLEFIRAWRSEWADSQITHTPEEVIDLGDRIVTRLTLAARGSASGTEVRQPNLGIVSRYRDGWIVRQDNYWEWADCVAALDLQEPR